MPQYPITLAWNSALSITFGRKRKQTFIFQRRRKSLMFYGRSRKINFPCVFRNGPENHIFSVPHKKRRNLLNLQRKKPKNHLLNVQRKKPKNQFSQCSMKVVGKLFFQVVQSPFQRSTVSEKMHFFQAHMKTRFPNHFLSQKNAPWMQSIYLWCRPTNSHNLFQSIPPIL